ncbi:peptide deformylase, partial [Mesorhizobium sp. M4B.F.Ca.ET.211.01.1.1]|uniref:peptide deformylase n=1 Tax=Mesorhizobium sp. M4B.F.Ca.ET.211.01.1.1 TaxID=2563954 RepID=UPI001FE1E6D2
MKYLDRNGQEQQLEAGEVLATCIQHEMDHLDGKLFIERLGQGVAPAWEMTPAAAEIVIVSVALALQSEADDEQPIISG